MHVQSRVRDQLQLFYLSRILIILFLLGLVAGLIQQKKWQQGRKKFLSRLEFIKSCIFSTDEKHDYAGDKTATATSTKTLISMWLPISQ